jgi:hypothetical protein
MPGRKGAEVLYNWTSTATMLHITAATVAL